MCGQLAQHEGFGFEMAAGRLVAMRFNGDAITINTESLELTLDVSADEIASRRDAWSPPKPNYTRGVLAKYARLVSSASTGAITDGAED